MVQTHRDKPVRCVDKKLWFIKKVVLSAQTVVLLAVELKSSYIYIKGARFRACIGVSELEREVGNDYVADLRLRYHIGKAMLTDDVNDTISYADVYDTVKEIMQQPAKLLEYVAHRIAE